MLSILDPIGMAPKEKNPLNTITIPPNKSRQKEKTCFERSQAQK
jgi:hypothetical protein